MFRMLTGFIFCFLLAAPLHAGNVITFGKDSSIYFPHQQHQTALGGCTECHGAKDPGPISQFGEQWAHANCTGCHNDCKTGPVECGGCHTQFSSM